LELVFLVLRLRDARLSVLLDHFHPETAPVVSPPVSGVHLIEVLRPVLDVDEVPVSVDGFLDVEVGYPSLSDVGVPVEGVGRAAGPIVLQLAPEEGLARISRVPGVFPLGRPGIVEAVQVLSFPQTLLPPAVSRPVSVEV